MRCKGKLMDWENLILLIFVVVPALGLPIALALRKKGGQKKLDELVQHLQSIGVKASIQEQGEEKPRTGGKRSWGERSEGVIAVEGRYFDSIGVASVSTQYGNAYYTDYMVKSPTLAARADAKKTTIVRKKSTPLLGKTVDIEWRGDLYLSQRLNFDYSLKYKLLQSDPKLLKGRFSIVPQPEHGHTRVRTVYGLPSPEFLEVVDIIARHIKSAV